MFKKFSALLLLILVALLVVPPTWAGEPATDALLIIPAIGVEKRVIELPYIPEQFTWDVAALGRDVGHLAGTAWLGEAGNIVIGGHYDLTNGRPGAFYRLKRLEMGDEIMLRQGDAERRYQVTEIRQVDPTDTSVVYGVAGDRLTLFTCDNYDPQTGIFHKRLVVIATPIN